MIKNLKNTVSGLIGIMTLTFPFAGYSSGLIQVTSEINMRETDDQPQLSQSSNKPRAISPKMFGAVGNGVVDDTEAFQKALDSGQNIVIEEGRYKINSTLKITRGDLFISGKNSNVTIFSNTTSRLVTANDVNNVTIRNISFQVLTNDTNEVANEWCVGWLLDPKTTSSKEPVAKRNKIIKCNFSSPNSCVNGVKLIAHRSGVGGRIDNFLIDSCQFTKIGRMAIEILGERDGNWYSNIRVTNCKFKDLGRHSKYGMAVSFSGDGSNNLAKNLDVELAKDIAVENSGAQYTTFQSIIYRNLKPNCIPYTVSGYDGYTPRRGNRVLRNVVIDNVSSSPQFINQINFLSERNKVSSASPFILANVHFATFNKDEMNSNNSSVILLRQGSSNNTFSNCLIGNRNASLFLTAIAIEKPGKNNYFIGTRYRRGQVGGNFFDHHNFQPDSTIITK